MWIPRDCENGWLRRRLRGLVVPTLALGWFVLPGCRTSPEYPREIAIAPIQISTHSVIEVRQESPASAPTTQDSARDPVGRDQPGVSLAPKGSPGEGMESKTPTAATGPVGRPADLEAIDQACLQLIEEARGIVAKSEGRPMTDLERMQVDHLLRRVKEYYDSQRDYRDGLRGVVRKASPQSEGNL